MKITVTGHKGFIGSHYYNYIKDSYDAVYPYDKKNGIADDLNNITVARNAPDCDVVVHLAATNGTRLFYENPTDVCINNTLPTINLIERYRNTNTKFVFASTCEIFNGAIDEGY